VVNVEAQMRASGSCPAGGFARAGLGGTFIKAGTSLRSAHDAFEARIQRSARSRRETPASARRARRAPGKNRATLGKRAGGKMSSDTVEKLITNAIHTAFIKYPEGDGGPNLDYEWIPPEQSSHITKAILLDLEAGGFQIVKKA
jgi:hypothetical protein